MNISKTEHGNSATLAASNTGYTIYQVSAGRKFHVENVIVTNFSGDAKIDVFDCASGGTGLAGVETSGFLKFRLMAGAVKTEAFGDDFVKGAVCISSVHVITNVSGLWIHVGGTEW